MFGIGLPELIIILVIALLFFGPKRLTDLSKNLGSIYRTVKKEFADGESAKDTDKTSGDKRDTDG